jgi:hypothetical protein
MVGERINTTRFNGEAQDHEALVGVRQEVEHAFATDVCRFAGFAEK